MITHGCVRQGPATLSLSADSADVRNKPNVYQGFDGICASEPVRWQHPNANVHRIYSHDLNAITWSVNGLPAISARVMR